MMMMMGVRERRMKSGVEIALATVLFCCVGGGVGGGVLGTIILFCFTVPLVFGNIALKYAGQEL